MTRAKAHGARAGEGRTCGRATLRATARERNAKGARIEATEAAQTQAAAIVGYRAGGGVPEPLNAVKTRVAFESRRRGLPCRATCVTAEGGQGNLEAPSEMPSRERKDRAHSRVPRATRAIVCARASGFQRFRDGFARVTKHRRPISGRAIHSRERRNRKFPGRPIPRVIGTRTKKNGNPSGCRAIFAAKIDRRAIAISTRRFRVPAARLR